MWHICAHHHPLLFVSHEPVLVDYSLHLWPPHTMPLAPFPVASVSSTHHVFHHCWSFECEHLKFFVHAVRMFLHLLEAGLLFMQHSQLIPLLHVVFSGCCRICHGHWAIERHVKWYMMHFPIGMHMLLAFVAMVSVFVDHPFSPKRTFFICY